MQCPLFTAQESNVYAELCVFGYYSVFLYCSPLTCNERRIDLSLPISLLYCRLLPWINTTKDSFRYTSDSDSSRLG